MMFFVRQLRRGFALATLAVLFTPGAPAAIPPAEKLLPEDTLFVISIPDFAKMREIWAKLPQVRLWHDPAMKPFRDNFVMKWKGQFVVPLERDLGVEFDDYSSLPQGQLTFAVTQEDWRGTGDHAPAVLLLLDVRDKSPQLKTNLVELRKKWTDAGKSIRTEKIRDVEFSILALSSNDVPPTLKQFFPRRQEVREVGKDPDKYPPTDGLIVGQFDSLLIVGTSMKAVEKVVVQLTGGSTPALADQAAFASNQLAMFRDAPLFGWVNAKALFDVLARLPPEKPNPAAPSPLPQFQTDRILAGLGLMGLKTVAVDLRDSNEGTLLELFLGTPDAQRQGIFKILTVEAKDSAPPAFVPADAVKFQRWRVDGQKLWAALEKILSDLSPQALNVWNYIVSSAELAAREKDPDYDLKRDFVGNLGDDWIRYQKAPRGSAPDELNSPPSLFLIGSPNAGQLLDALKGPLSIWSPQALNPEAREFLGRKVYTIPVVGGIPFIGTARPVARKLNYAAGNGYVAMSTDASMVEEFLRSSEGQARSLCDRVGLADAMQMVGGAGGGWSGYENQVEGMRAFFDALKQEAGAPTNAPGELSPLANSVPFAGPEKSFKDWMNFSLLPPFNEVSNYFSFGVYGGSATVDGITFRYFHPARRPLKEY